LSVRSPLPLPPPATLVPYTTLFRSDGPAGDGPVLRPADPAAAADWPAPVAQPPRAGLPALPHHPQHDVGRGGQPVEGEGPLPQGDRKSTRLNSSHQIISYAVFCLQK